MTLNIWFIRTLFPSWSRVTLSSDKIKYVTTGHYPTDLNVTNQVIGLTPKWQLWIWIFLSTVLCVQGWLWIVMHRTPPAQKGLIATRKKQRELFIIIFAESSFQKPSMRGAIFVYKDLSLFIWYRNRKYRGRVWSPQELIKYHCTHYERSYFGDECSRFQ